MIHLSFIQTHHIKQVLKRVLPLRVVNVLRKKKERRLLSFYTRSSVLPFRPERFPLGINLIGFIQGENGLGQSCRLLAKNIQTAGIPFTIYPITQASLENNETAWDKYFDFHAPFGINVIHVNPLEMPSTITKSYRSLLDNRYNIGFWLWEMECFPDRWLDRLAWLDEIWTPSEFISCGIRQKTKLPVYSIPYGLEAPLDPTCDRKRFGLPEDVFLFLIIGDGRSVVERKNPLGAVKAYVNAFLPSDCSVGLVLKLAQIDVETLRKIHSLLDGYPNIIWINNILPKEMINSLIKCVDVLLSLHRSEGFGLVMAEAMLLGIPVVSTNWSANTEYMDRTIACMLDYRIVTLQRDIPPYSKGDCWADPDIMHATRCMQKLRDDPIFYSALAEKAKSHIATHLSPARMGYLLRERVDAIMPSILATPHRDIERKQTHG